VSAVALALVLVGARVPVQDALAHVPVQDALARVPVLRAHGLVHVEVERDGGDAPLLCLIDTGANRSAIDPRRAGELAVVAEVEVVGTTGALRAETVRLAGLTLGGYALPEIEPTRRDLGGLLPFPDRPIDAILGTDALAGLALTLDFARGEVELRPGGGAERDGDVEMKLDAGIPTLPATLGGVETVLRIDTGASLFETQDVYVNVPPALWRALAREWPELEPISRLQGSGASGETVELPVYRVPLARIGPRELDSACVIVQPAAGYFAAPDAKGFVGNNFLEKLGRVTLDLGAQRLRVDGPAAPR
jgi:hypothetical protein